MQTNRPKYFIGPMSKNIINAIIEYSIETNNTIGLIPSRRQVEWDGGYVMSTEALDYLAFSHKIILERDHAGPGQGQTDDDGYESLKHDCSHMDIIHIDPWKKYSDFWEGVDETYRMIKFCYDINSDLEFEIGTEEAIRPFTEDELHNLVMGLKFRLHPDIFKQIKYLVIQSGTSLKGNTQTGSYDKERLKRMIEVAKKFDLLTKEHNGDYIPVSVIKEKFELGLDAINIAPEFGLIETQTYLDEMNKNKDEISINKFWEICYHSKKWEKWVDKDFEPFIDITKLIQICGHYVFSYPEFIKQIKSKYNLDEQIKINIKNKLKELHES
jgi:fructose/tagatose bisphosphate aldolase